MRVGTVTIGGIVLGENLEVSEDDSSLSLEGQESAPPSTEAAVIAAHLNVLGLQDMSTAVTFSDKVELNGFYSVSSADSNLVNLFNGAYTTATWSIKLKRLGSEREVEFESRVPTIARSAEYTGQAATYWHATPVNTSSYYTGSTVPTFLDRISVDGTVRVYTGIPTGVAPRWTAPVADYMKGSCRILVNGIRVAGTRTSPVTSWELNNALVQVQSSGASINVAVWADGAWESQKGYVPIVNGTAVTGTPEMTILRNDSEEATIRLSYPQTTGPGRLTVDLNVRRGARVVNGIISRHSAATIGMRRTAAEAVTAQTATGGSTGVRATNADANGNRFVMGSSRVLTTALTTAEITDTTVTRLDFFLGAEVAATPQAGDAYANLLSQYLGTNGDRTRVVRR